MEWNLTIFKEENNGQGQKWAKTVFNYFNRQNF